jgi:prepilin-type N-terminal cleavage/methylation domain-containing protein
MMNLKKHLAKNKAARGGFTLIELIVVLMILVGLAGMVIPAVTDMVTRTHTSTASGNIAEVANAVARYETQYLQYPNNLDSLVSNLTTPTALDVALATTNAAGVEIVESLEHAGITTVGVHTAGDGTFDPPATLTDLDNTHSLLGLSEDEQEELGLETVGVPNKYVVLGVGNINTAIGKTMTEAPVEFPESGEVNPTTSYRRFLAVFDVSGERAKLVKILGPHGTGLDSHMGEYFEVVADN